MDVSQEGTLAAPELRVSRIALGCGNFGAIGSVPELFGQGLTDDQAFALMDAAGDAGIDRFDTSRKGALILG